MAHQVIMLENECLIWIAGLHLIDKMGEVIVICFVGLPSCGDELHLFTPESTNANGARQVLRQILLLTLED